uniref:FERM domain-containing protein n=1 Tax=Ciona savignyi TaxID=51511 RepID=H2ZQQ1_CIOSA
MVNLALKILIKQSNMTRTMQFDPACIVYDACRIIREKTPEAQVGLAQDYSLFLADKDPKKGVWLESRRPLEYYLLRDGDILEYKQKQRPLKVRTLDASIKTVMIDDSNTVDQLMITICTRLGIVNHEEYSLVRDAIVDEAPAQKKASFDTGTLLRPGTTDRKFETLKKKLHTDDELSWLSHGQTLREQGVDELETLILRRKYFYSDQNVDSRDPIQLNLLYVQSRDGILKGQYPVSEKDATTFAAIQCQIQLGNHDEKKHKPGYIELKDFLPKEYVKSRGIEKKIFAEHKLFENLSEIEAKVKYTKNCRALKTYGVTFFLVKEKMKGRNKLVPRLMGVTRESVMRVDEKTKDMLKVWPLTSVKRWAASPKSFTLDFGDYQDGYYSVQTTEGEQIAQLIAGYIDIILKKRQAKDNIGIDDDEDAAIVEDTVSPHQAQFVAMHGGSAGSFHSGSVAMPGVIGNSSARPDSYSMGAMQPPTQVTTHSNLSYGGQPLTAAQQAFMGNIEHGFNACRAAHEGFNNKAHLPPLGSDAASRQWKMNAVAENRHHIQSNLAAIDAATATVITKTSGDPEGRSYTTVGSAITTISSNLNDMTRSMQLMASLLDDGSDGDGLMRAARDLTAAIQDLLRAAKPNSEEPRQNLLGAAGKIGASHDILKYIGDGGDDEFQASRDILMNLAKQVASATAALVLQAKTVASQSQDQITQNDVITSATKCALSTSQLVACTKVVGPTIYNPSCKEQLIDAAREVSHSVDGCLESTRVATNDPNLLQALGDAASNVGKALNDLINHIRSGADMTNGKYDDQCEVILNATDKLCNSMGNAAVMAKQAKLLGQATSDLVNLLKLEADEAQDDDWRKWLLSTVKLVAEATAKMVEAAKGTASNPHDSQQQQNLKLAAENLRAATNAATQNALRKKMIRRLEEAASHAAVAATQTIAAANAAEPYNTNKTSQNQLLTHSKSLQSEHIPKLLQSIHGAYDDLKNPTVQQNLITASNEFVPPATKMVGYSKAVVPTVSEKSTALQLANCTKKLALAVAELKTASVKAGEVCGASGIDAALETVTALDRQLSVYCNDAKNNQLQPLPGQTMQHCAQELGATSKAVGASMAQLLTRSSSVRNCSPQGNEDYTGMAARYTANALRTLVGAARGVAANLPDLDSQLHLLETCRDVMDKSVNLMQEAKLAVEDPENPENRQRLAQVAKAVSHALNNCINCLPGQRDVDEALKNIAESSKRLLSNQFPVNNANFQTAQAQLNRTAEELNIAANDLVGASRGTPSELAASSTNYNDRFTELLDAGMNVAGQSRDKDDQGQVIGNLKSISMASSKLLLAAKALSADPGAPNAKNQLSAAARAVTESINNLITHCTETAPGQKECDNALRQLKTVKEMLENPNEPVNDFSYFDCLESVMDNSKMLGESMSGITQHARASELESFGEAVTATQKSLIGLTEAAAQAAYLVGIADPNSEAGTQGLVDQTQFARANQAIQMACQSLLDPSSNQPQVLSAATIVAKYTSALCNVCRVASNKTTNTVARKHFVHSAKEVAHATANLVRTIKALDGNFSEENRANCSQATKPLIDAVENLTTFASNPEFASVPAKISNEAREAQRPIIESGKQMLESSSELIKTARKLANNPKDPPTWQVMAGHSRVVSDSIKKLIANIRDNAPGQKECDEAIDRINESIQQFNDASLSAMDQSLPALTNINKCVDPLANAAKEDAAQLGRQVVAQMASYFEPLAHATIGAASNSVNHQRQMDILDYSKTLAESALQLMFAAKEGGGNPKVSTLNVQAGEDDTFADYQTSIMRHCRAILTTLAKKVSNHIKRSIQDLGEACKELVTASGMVQSNPQGLYTKKDLNRMLARTSIEKVSYVMSSLQEGGRGTQACINAHTKVQGIIGDLDTTLMFVTSGALNPESDNESFAEHRENILATAKALVEDTKQLVAGAAGGQEKLAGAAQSASQTISKLADVVKSGASSLGADDPDTQVILINAVRDVASALADLINSTKDASGKSTSDQSMLHLKASAKAMVTNVTSLLKTVKSVEDEAAKGPRAIEQTINSIKQELKSVAGEERRATPEELIQITKPITNATAKAVAAGKFCRQEDMIVCANMGRKAVFDMIHICRASAASTDDQVQQKETLKFGAGVAEAYVSLLSNVLLTSQQPGNNDLKKNLNPLSKNVATAVSNLVRSGESMKGTDWVDPNDPNVIAEQELLAAALSIEAAAKKLAQLRPRKKPKQADESLNFEEQILEAAKSIATATTALVKAASAAQKELVLQGKVGSIAAMRHDDGQWSQGLISAAQMVARATGNLCEAANQAVQGEASEEKLVTSAKQVASSTAQLLVACKVKADPNSENMKRLQIAGNAVKHASEDLVKAASESANSDDEVEVVINSRLVGGIAQEMMAQEEILRKERELQSARQKLAQIRRMRYK